MGGFGDIMKKQLLKQFLPDIMDNLGMIDEFVIQYLKKVPLEEGEKYTAIMLLPKETELIIHTVACNDSDQVIRIISSLSVGEFAKQIVELEKHV